MFTDSLFPFLFLSLFVQLSTLKYTLYNFTGVNVLEAMVTNISVDTHFPCGNIWVILEWHEGCRPMVNGVGSAKGQTLEKGFRGDEGRGEDDRIDVLCNDQRTQHL